MSLFLLYYFYFLEELQLKKEQETESKFFTEMPNPHYMVVTQLLLKQ